MRYSTHCGPSPRSHPGLRSSSNIASPGKCATRKVEMLLTFLVAHFPGDAIFEDDLSPGCERGDGPQCVEYRISCEIRDHAEPGEETRSIGLVTALAQTVDQRLFLKVDRHET